MPEITHQLAQLRDAHQQRAQAVAEKEANLQRVRRGRRPTRDITADLHRRVDEIGVVGEEALCHDVAMFAGHPSGVESRDIATTGRRNNWDLLHGRRHGEKISAEVLVFLLAPLIKEKLAELVESMPETHGVMVMTAEEQQAAIRQAETELAAAKADLDEIRRELNAIRDGVPTA